MTLAATNQARQVLLSQDAATLSTHSADCPGYPFGSLVPLGFDDCYRPVLLISRLAQHTRNIVENPNVSLMVSNIAELGNHDVQTSTRVTILGKAHKLDVAKEAEAISRYCRFYPQAESYTKELDFDFYRMEPAKVRLIAGFGQINWVEIGQLFSANPLAGDAERDICAHMNEDHGDALITYCQQTDIAIPSEVSPVMVGVDAFGFFQRVGARIFRFEFSEPVTSTDEVRRALIAMLRS